MISTLGSPSRCDKRPSVCPTWFRGTSGPAERGYLVVNPSNHVAARVVDLPGLASLPTVTKPVYAAHADEDHKYVVVDVPSMGFAWLTGGPAPKPSKRSATSAGRGVSDLQRVLRSIRESDDGSLAGPL